MNQQDFPNMVFSSDPPPAFANTKYDLSERISTNHFDTDEPSILDEEIPSDATAFSAALKLTKYIKSFSTPAPLLEDKVKKAKLFLNETKELFGQVKQLLSREPENRSLLDIPDEMLSKPLQLYKSLLKNKERNIKLVTMKSNNSPSSVSDILLPLVETLKMDGAAVEEWKLLRKQEERRQNPR